MKFTGINHLAMVTGSMDSSQEVWDLKDKLDAADFEYIPDMNLILIPTFFDNRVVAYQLK